MATDGIALSLCMIVRDEQELLPQFLRRAAGLWDELCAVDTGSTDGTRALLEAAGARVVSRPWNDDFAAARNVSLDLARGRWVLVLDADEMVSPELVAQVRALLHREDAGAATVRMVNRLPHGQHREANLLRLFRSDPAVRFRHRIHEDASASIDELLARTGKSLVHLSGAVDHLGYVRARAAARDKRSRDERLLRAALSDDPTDLYSYFKLLELARFWSDRRLWREAAEAAASAMGAGARALAPHFGGELVALVAQGLFARDPAAQVRWMGPWERAVEASAAFHLARGEALERSGELPGAAAAFRRACACTAGARDPQVATTRPLLGQARVAIARGELATARDLVDEALAHGPRDPEALLAGLALARATGGATEVEAFVSALAQRHGPSPELSRARGEEAFLQGEFEAARTALASAAAAPGGERAALRLAQAELALGDLGAAAHTARALAASLPEAALGVMLCQLLEGRDCALDLDLEPAEASAELRPWVDCVLRGRRADLLAPLRQAALLLAEPFPWLPRYVGAT